MAMGVRTLLRGFVSVYVTERGFPMRGFLLGFIAAVFIVLLAEFLWVRLGFVDPRADVAESKLERAVAMPSLDASLDRHASQARNPVDATDANLTAGMKIYQTNCAGCHGDIHQTHALFGDEFYPRVREFMEDAPDMPENQNFYIIQHGVRLSGMPAWKGSLNEQEMWQVTTFLSHMNKLSPLLTEQWKAMTTPSTTAIR
jgi:mono/diheme cytochrome c family protein